MIEAKREMTEADGRRLLELAIQIKDNRNAPSDALREAFNLLRDTRGATASHVPIGWVGFLKIVGMSRARLRAEMKPARRAKKLSHVAAQP